MEKKNNPFLVQVLGDLEDPYVWGPQCNETFNQSYGPEVGSKFERRVGWFLASQPLVFSSLPACLFKKVDVGRGAKDGFVRGRTDQDWDRVVRLVHGFAYVREEAGLFLGRGIYLLSKERAKISLGHLVTMLALGDLEVFLQGLWAYFLSVDPNFLHRIA